MPPAQRAALGDFFREERKYGFAAFLQNAPPIQKNALPLFYMKRLLLLFFALLQMNGLFAQIQLLNPSFEGSPLDSCWSGNVPHFWTSCDYNSIANCKPYQGSHPSSVVDGQFWLIIRTCDFSRYTISQQLECSLLAGVTYTSSLNIASYDIDSYPTFFNRALCRIGLSNDSCTISKAVFSAGPLDTFWVKYDYTFTADSAYPWFLIECKRHIGSSCANLMVDALSPIYVLNAHQVHSYAADTLLPIGSTACLHLNAYTDTTYSRVWWEQIGIGLLDNQIDAGTVCTDTNTTYVIHMLGNDSTCAGYLPSSDTVRVRFYDPNSISPPLGGRGVKLYPNPATDMLTIETEQTGVLSIYNSIGQLVLQSNIQNRTSNISIAEFARGIYHYKFTLAQNKTEVYGKLVKQ